MGASVQLPSERHYHYHLLRMAIALAFFLAVGTGMMVALLRPGLRAALVLTPAGVFVVAGLVLNVALRGRRWLRPDTEEARIARDEWTQSNIGRARRVALNAVWAAQVPLMFIVAYLPPDPTVTSSVMGMAFLTMAAAGTGFFGSYLIFSRQPFDG